MTALDVLKEYKAYLKIISRRLDMRPKEKDFFREDIDKAQIIVDALEKQIPKRANKTEYPWAQCPVCGGSIALENIIEYIQNKEQSHCGQKLDWSDTE